MWPSWLTGREKKTPAPSLERRRGGCVYVHVGGVGDVAVVQVWQWGHLGYRSLVRPAGPHFPVLCTRRACLTSLPSLPCPSLPPPSPPTPGLTTRTRSLSLSLSPQSSRAAFSPSLPRSLAPPLVKVFTRAILSPGAFKAQCYVHLCDTSAPCLLDCVCSSFNFLHRHFRFVYFWFVRGHHHTHPHTHTHTQTKKTFIHRSGRA